MTPDPLPVDGKAWVPPEMPTVAPPAVIDTPTPEDKDRQRRALALVVTPPEGKWANPRPFGMGRHTKRYLHRSTGAVILAKSTAAPPWLGRKARKARRKAQTLARRLNRD